MGNMGYVRVRCWCGRCSKHRFMVSATIKVRDIKTRRGMRRLGQGNCPCGAGMCKFMGRK